MVGKPKNCISRYLGGLDRGWNMVHFWLVIVTMSFEDRKTVNLICFVIC
jgi:hypothetical protein